ncbi:hypothetical protein CVT24_006616 [Panaeolus cyanescens]|uniref:Uncharacterized protein n=1 Tax=Panaeolus cyanescens TaxID=181874 RepID=A0A409YSB1_9AGAR|nr:hypothetical protein CVT24_006616 [Panaeolus cyanescens]
MSRLAPGCYSIWNKSTLWPVTTKTHEDIAQPGHPVRTRKKIDQEVLDWNIKLKVSIDGCGLYTFQNEATKMYIGSGGGDDGTVAAAWTMSPQSWDIDLVGPGVWTISMPGGDSYWCDNDGSGSPWAERYLAFRTSSNTMSGPAPGTYRIHSHKSSWAISTQIGEVQAVPGETIKTVKDTHFSEYCHLTVLTGNGGQYTFRNQKTKLFIADSKDEQGNTVPVWSLSPYYWDIEPAGPGIWLISTYGDEDSFWFERSAGDKPYSEVSLKERKGHVDAESSWYLIAA